MMEVGRLCVKLAGRDSGKKCVIVDVINDTFVMIDGETRRRKCNIRHIEPLNETIKLKKGAAHKDVVAEFKKLGIAIKETKPKQKTEKPAALRVADRKKTEAAESPIAKPKKEVKAEKPKVEKKA
jgi:large subunit ribosomal protein L14e